METSVPKSISQHTSASFTQPALWDPPPVVIVADSVSHRAEQLKEAIRLEFEAELLEAKDWNGLKQYPNERPEARLVVLAEGLRGIPPLGTAINALRGFFGPFCNLLFVAVEQTIPYPEGQSFRSVRPGTEDVGTAVVNIIDRARFLPKPRPLPDLDPVSDRDPILRYQIQSLDRRDCKFAVGEIILRRIARNLWGPQTTKIAVRRLIQGFSGDLLLRVDLDPSIDGVSTFALKVTSYERKKHLLNELKHRKELEETFSKGGLKFAIPPMCKSPIGRSRDDEQFVVESGSFAAAFYFLGGKLGTFPNLEEVYIGAETARALSPREAMKNLLDLLWDTWHVTATLGRSAPLWACTPDCSPGSPPPYFFSDQWRAKLLGWLERFEPYGRHKHISEWWAADRNCVVDWLRGDSISTSLLGRACAAVVSPAHGDLNKTNVMFWLDDNNSPFLIDFSTFQPQGHALNDLAHLETEIKFLLMDREAETPLRDFDGAQMPVWRQLEDHLSSDRWDIDDLTGFSPDQLCGARAALCYIRSIRQNARNVYNKVSGSDRYDFLVEYNAALLYHTLSVISYEDVSPFKRLLAVYSAARIVNYCQRAT